VEILVVPEPAQAEREVLLAALREREDGRFATRWREVALREGVQESCSSQGTGATSA